MQDTHHTVYFELRDALTQPGCPICALALRSLQRYFGALTYESINDPGIRATIRAAYGFCEVHGRMLRDAHDALGTAIIHRDVFTTLTDALARTRFNTPSVRDRFRQMLYGHDESLDSDQLTPQRACPACIHRRMIEQRAIEVLLSSVREHDVRSLFQQSAGLCVPHLRLTLEQAKDEATVEQLKTVQIRIWQRLMDELDQFIRKQDHRFAHEPSGSERDVWSRAIDVVSGRDGLGCQERP